MTTLRAVSYGGGVQSTALLVLAAQGVIDFPLFLMSNVGDDSEHPDTLVYVRDHARPYAEAHCIDLVVLQKDKPRADDCTGEGQLAVDGKCPVCTKTTDDDVVPNHKPVETLMGRLMRPGSRSLPIPVRMSNGAPGTRSCTMDFKIRVIGKELKRRGATADNPAHVAVGFSTDEFHRANRKKAQPWEVPHYPLLDLGMDRGACEQVIRDAGLPVPPKSACYFCPFHRPATWAEMRRDEPELFDKSADLEDVLNERRKMLDRDPVYLTRYNRPLREAIQEAGPTLDFDGPENCDEGYCWT